MYEQREFHDLHTGDRFSLHDGDDVTYRVDDGDYIDYWGNRLVMYPSQDGMHGHLANHEAVWVVTE